MKKVVWLKRINVLLFLVFLMQASTGLGHGFIGEALFEDLHPTGGILLILLVALHLMLNWGWVKTSYLDTTRKR